MGHWYTQYEKALLRALLEPTAELRKLEAAGDYSARLALLEEQKSLPWQAVWKCIVSVTIPQQVANGWRACGLMKKKF